MLLLLFKYKLPFVLFVAFQMDFNTCNTIQLLHINRSEKKKEKKWWLLLLLLLLLFFINWSKLGDALLTLGMHSNVTFKPNSSIYCIFQKNTHKRRKMYTHIRSLVANTHSHIVWISQFFYFIYLLRSVFQLLSFIVVFCVCLCAVFGAIYCCYCFCLSDWFYW